MNKRNKKIKVASLFSGCGGGDLGITGGFKFLGDEYDKLDFEVVWANDIDPHAVQTYRKNFGPHIVEGDITKIKAKDIPDHDLLVGGFPCQSFSIVGMRKGLEDPRGKLYQDMIRVLKAKKPTAFIAENVKGLKSVNNGKVLEQMLEDFRKAGYEVRHQVLNASYFGVPQKRERLFIIGIRKDKKLDFNFPLPFDHTVPLNKVLEDHKSIDPKYYFSSRALAGLKKANKAFNKGRAQDLMMPCNTISTHLAKVSLNGTDPVLLIRTDSYRRLTPREAARIQSFPDNFVFEGSEAKQYIQIGNAIPPVLMWHVAKAVREQIFNGGRFYKKEKKRDNVSHTLQEYSVRKESIPVFARK